MTFANPSYLWALAGLSIPLAIHLLSRKEGKVIRVGSLRHIEESNTSQFKSIRLNEILLLLVRMLLVTLLAFFLSGAQCSGTETDKKVVYVEKGIDADSLMSQGYELHEIPAGNYWTFAEELNRSHYETVVISYSKAENFKGERIALNENIKWITAASPSKEFQALAWRVGDSVFIRNASSGPEITTYSTSVGIPDSIKIIEPKAVHVATGNEYVIAALKVLKKEYKLPIQISVVDTVGEFDQRYSDQDVALNQNIVIELFKALYPELQSKVAGVDARVLPDEFSWTSSVPKSARPNVTSSGIEKYLILIFIVALATERFLAIKKNQ